jgi:membrane protein
MRFREVKSALTKPLVKAYASVRGVLNEYSSDNGSLVAGALSFYIFLSLVPLALLAIAIFAFVLGSTTQAQQRIMEVVGVNTVGPGIGRMVKQAIEDRGAATGFAVLAFLWSGISLVATLESAMNHIWNVEQKRGYLNKRLVALGMLLMLIVLLGISFGMTAAITAIRSHDLIPELHLGWFWDLLAYLLPLVITISTFTALYKILPNTKVALKPALIGGVFAGVMWEIAKYVFSYYVANFANYNQVYGSLGGVILLLLWIYYSSIIVILGAEIASMRSRHQIVSGS